MNSFHVLPGTLTKWASQLLGEMASEEEIMGRFDDNKWSLVMTISFMHLAKEALVTKRISHR